MLVDWDKKEFKSEIPSNSPFLLKVYSASPIGSTLTLVRFLDTKPTFYYKEIPLIWGGPI
ncbi:hypothetical protein GCM10027577_40870 [Spirosoma fluminis]